MRRAVIALAALGSGTLLTFVLAGLAFLASPEGRLVPVGNPTILREIGGVAPVPFPERGPVMVDVGGPVDPALVEQIQEELRLQEELRRSGAEADPVPSTP